MRPRAALAAAAALPLTALAIMLGSSGSAAGVQTGTTLTWHTLRLTNGWHTLPAGSNFGSPAWAVSGGIVYLRGAIQGGAGSDLATLPSGARPRHNLWICYVTSGPTTSGMLVRRDGLISLFGPGDAQTFSSLAGVSFPRSA